MAEFLYNIGMEFPARLLVFDLDGTLVDSKEDLANAVNVAIESFDLPPLPHPTIYSYVGDGASALMRREKRATTRWMQLVTRRA